MKAKNKAFHYIKVIVLALISSMALTTDFIEIPGKYNIVTILLLVLLAFFYHYVDRKEWDKIPVLWVPAGLSAFFYLIGRSYSEYNSSELIWGSPLKVLWFLFCLAGVTVAFQAVFRVAYEGFHYVSMHRELPDKIDRFLFGKYGFFRVAVVIIVAWLPVIIICYPGGSCVDVTYQIAQAIGRIPFTTLHPIMHTLFVGFFINVLHKLTGSYNLGLYLQILVQSLIMASVMSFSIKTLYKKGVNRIYLLMVLGIYCFAPFYSNFATMTIKDTLFNTWILLYFVILINVLDEKENMTKPGLVIPTVLSALGVMLFRNNGLIIIAGSSLGLIVYFILQRETKNRIKIERIMFYAVFPLVLFVVVDKGLTGFFQAETYSGGKEALSIPFQQTARYVKEYGSELTREEWQILDPVFEDEMKLGEIYDPNISDPVKRQFNVDCSNQDVKEYLLLWGKLFFKHPKVYVDAFFNHCYGWFDVGLRNSIRYEGRMELFYTPAKWGNTDKILYYYYNLMNRFPLTGLLENVGIYVWWMVLLTIRMFKTKKHRKVLVFMLPLYLSLLVCVASPACLLHPRYAFPILFTLPFLTGAMSTTEEQ